LSAHQSSLSHAHNAHIGTHGNRWRRLGLGAAAALSRWFLKHCSLQGSLPPRWSECGERKTPVGPDLTGVRERFPAQRYSALKGSWNGSRVIRSLSTSALQHVGPLALGPFEARHWTGRYRFGPRGMRDDPDASHWARSQELGCQEFQIPSLQPPGPGYGESGARIPATTLGPEYGEMLCAGT
jgi:hypothetical protein